MRTGRTLLGFFAAFVLAVLLAGCGGDDNTAATSVWINTDLAGADLDGDGLTDVVTVGALQRSFGDSTGYMKVYLQSVSGAFTAVQYQVGRTPWRLQIADVSGDGAPDLLVLDVTDGSGASDDVLYLMVQDTNSRGRFLLPRAIASGLFARDFVTADVNLDFAPDIVIAGVPGGGTGATQLLQFPARRGFFDAPTVLPLAGRPARLATGQLAGSGRADLVSYSLLDASAAANAPGQLVVNTSSLVAGATGFGYAMPGTVMASHLGVNAQSLQVADVDLDGRQDIVACFTPFSAAFEAKVSVVLQRAVGAPEVVDTSLAALSGLDSFVVADLTGDGRPDVATTGFFPVGSPSTVRSRTNLLVPTVGGRYLPIAAIEMPVAMSRINAADVDGDGLNDLLLLGGDHRAYVMLQAGGAPGSFFAPRPL